MSNTFRNLMAKLEELTAKSARFRRVVLHVHSPYSHDFGEGECDKRLNEKSQYTVPGGEVLYLRHLKDKFDLVAITDHMKVGYACRSAQSSPPCPDFCVLPGIELNVRLGPPLNSVRLHFLVIFPHSKSVGEIERIFPGRIPADQDRTGHEEIEVGDLAQLVRKIQEEHAGLCIAAHVDSEHGVRMLFRQTAKDTLALFNPDGTLTPEQERQISESFKDYLVAAKFDGIEVKSPSDRKYYTWETEPQSGVKHHVSVFLTFDAHNIEMLSRPDRVTYVKMSEVSWQGLADAIKFPHTRIRFSHERVPPPYIVGIETLSPERRGFFPILQLGFVENLNCIIGPRGSGKSTVVDALRYLFGYNRTLDELESEDLANAIVQRQERNLANSIIRVVYRVSEDEVHFLEATYDPKSSYATKVYDIDGNPLLVTDVERDGRYPLRLFGWSEIETLGRDPARQRDLLDKLVTGLSGYQDRQRELRQLLSQNSRSIRFQLDRLEEILQSDNSEIKHYKEYRKEFERLNTPEVRELFANLDQEREHLDFLQRLHSAMQAFRERFEHVLPVKLDELLRDEECAEHLFLIALDETLRDMLPPGSPLETWWDKIAKTFIELPKIQHRIAIDLKHLGQAISELSYRVGSLAGQTDQEIGRIEGQIRQQVSADPTTQVLADLRDEAKKRLEHVESLRERYNNALKDVNTPLKRRRQILDELVSCHNAISALREAKKTKIEDQLNEFQAEDMVISLNFIPDGDRERFIQHLKDISFLSDAHRNFRAKKWPQLIAEACTPIQFAQCVLDQKPEPLVQVSEIEGKAYEITLEDAQKIIQAVHPFGHDDMAEVQTVNEHKLHTVLAIQEIEWDDSERILRNGQPVDTSSPGQRSSAMLPLIALAESVPLLIDQPEDNLDNRMVGKVLVDILAKLKEQRQIIVATHNPNIVVLGDAEQVAVLDAISDVEGKVEEPQASVDHPFIIKRIIELLEGGKEAFETRRKRYLQD